MTGLLVAAMYVFLSSLGLLLASFLGVIIYRYPKGQGFIWGRSMCDNCKIVIPWYRNIPVISFLTQGGKCANCNVRIPAKYFLLELILPTLFILGYLFSPIGFHFMLICMIAFFMLAIFFIDYEHQIIPDALIFLPLCITVAYLVLTNNSSIYEHLFTGLLAASILMVIHLVTLGRGMGLGDVKFAILGGIYFTFYQSLVWLFLSFLTGAVIGVILLLLGKAKLGRHIPFGPFLVAAFFLELFMQL